MSENKTSIKRLNVEKLAELLARTGYYVLSYTNPETVMRLQVFHVHGRGFLRQLSYINVDTKTDELAEIITIGAAPGYNFVVDGKTISAVKEPFPDTMDAIGLEALTKTIVKYVGSVKNKYDFEGEYYSEFSEISMHQLDRVKKDVNGKWFTR